MHLWCFWWSVLLKPQPVLCFTLLRHWSLAVVVISAQKNSIVSVEPLSSSTVMQLRRWCGPGSCGVTALSTDFFSKITISKAITVSPLQQKKWNATLPVRFYRYLTPNVSTTPVSWGYERLEWNVDDEQASFFSVTWVSMSSSLLWWWYSVTDRITCVLSMLSKVFVQLNCMTSVRSRTSLLLFLKARRTCRHLLW